MIWVAWRQHRTPLLTTGGLLAAIAAVMTYHRFDMLDYLSRCAVTEQPCAGFHDRYGGYLQLIRLVLLALPALVGMFIGGPLFARDLEQDTHILSLTQSVGRTRWWATKLLVGGVPVVAMMLALGLVAAWALAPVSELAGFARMQHMVFEIQGLVLGPYTLLGLAVGATAGLLSRRTLPAMVAAVVAYVVVLAGVGVGVRPHYAEPVQAVTGVVEQGSDRIHHVETDVDRAQVLMVANSYRDQDGNPVAFSWGCLSAGAAADCPQRTGPITEVTSYQPASRFWAFQSIESGIFAALGAVVLALGWWRLRRRVW
ncbi:ABC transporter permease [Goodfellowiella coeruleoviolacea]|uniref:ABC-2 family transporter protein n=1 Tax=Goodfellowiella coeruleoviolacea TaxID=334858 RepID=A0AAE3GPX7_9PSEU|nr:ABC transporter permease [Goodfellowiella coeruleoviolacea]MCP2170023.1 ABC-2 family transporter protein [Goodfellowiella coeruleoviolacea]